MKKKNIVTIGGGTGSFTLLSGLRKYPLNISAIVSVADDGGSTGRLRDELGVLPPGDVRQCLVALSDSSDVLRELMNYRFENGDLKGHNFGNLLLSALEKIKGNFADASMEAARILNVKGQVIPVTNNGNMRLEIKLNNGKILQGEKVLDYHKDIHKYGISGIKLQCCVKACKRAIERIKSADYIIIGPGDLYASIIPNLLVDDVSQAIASSKAMVIYNCNLTNKKGQTQGYDVDRYVQEIERYIGTGRVNFVTYNKTRPSEQLISKYEQLEGENMIVVLNDPKKKRSFKLIQTDLLQQRQADISTKDLLARKHSFIRHDSEKLAGTLHNIFFLKEKTTSQA